MRALASSPALKALTSSPPPTLISHYDASATEHGAMAEYLTMGTESSDLTSTFLPLSLNPPPIDHLTKLAPELLEKIFDYHPYTVAVSKTLLPYDRSRRFNLLSISSFAALRRLLEALRGNGSLGGYCQRLLFCADTTHKQEEVMEDLRATFDLLPQVANVSLFGSFAGSNLALTEAVCGSCFKNMGRLHLWLGSRGIQENPNRILDIIKHIRHYPSLKELRLAFRPGCSPTPLPLPPPIETPIQLPNLTHLELVLKVDDTLATCLIEAMPSLTHFSFEPDNATAEQLRKALQACPSSLLSLTLTDGAGRSTPPSDSELIEESLCRFLNLELLRLEIRFFSRELLHHLKDPLPLHSLILGPQALHAVHSSDLYNLIDPKSPYHNSTLKQIRLSTVGTQDEYDEYYPHENHWDFPNWIEGQMDYKGVKELVEFGRRNGVEVFGRTVDALEIEERLNRETSGAGDEDTEEEEEEEDLSDDYTNGDAEEEEFSHD